ncbi:hypothetical protein B0H19DRAFT_1270702 [Mycena capillaripes]|nr:hypothetical protein B0H19DRAFT_1270702 [Mycena capillaripes]
MQHADTDVAKVDIQLSPAVKLYGQRMDTPSSAVLLPQDYNKETPTRKIDAPEQIHQDRQQVEDSEQGRTRTSFTSDSKTVMSWEPPSTQQDSTSGSTTSTSLEQRLRALEMRVTSIDEEGPPSYDTKS